MRFKWFRIVQWWNGSCVTNAVEFITNWLKEATVKWSLKDMLIEMIMYSHICAYLFKSLLLPQSLLVYDALFFRVCNSCSVSFSHALAHISLFLSRKRNSNSIITSVCMQYIDFIFNNNNNNDKKWQVRNRSICNSNIASLIIISITWYIWSLLRLTLIVWISNEFLSQIISYPIEMETLRMGVCVCVGDTSNYAACDWIRVFKISNL